MLAILSTGKHFYLKFITISLTFHLRFCRNIQPRTIVGFDVGLLTFLSICLYTRYGESSQYPPYHPRSHYGVASKSSPTSRTITLYREGRSARIGKRQFNTRFPCSILLLILVLLNRSHRPEERQRSGLYAIKERRMARDRAYQKAVKRIEVACRFGMTALDLSRAELGKPPEWLRKLTPLQKLFHPRGSTISQELFV